MKKDTRKQFNAYLAQVGEVNDVEDTSVQFNVVPAAVQGLQDKIVEQSTFLPKINIFTVSHAKGENIKAGSVGPASGRSDTAKNERREPKNALSMEGFGYELVQTNTVFPAPAGMNRYNSVAVYQWSSVPCARRDEPDCCGFVDFPYQYSLRPQG